MALIDLMNSIAQMEGYFRTDISTLAQKNNNPGNLRYANNQVGSSGGFAVFATPEDGWSALQSYIEKNSNLTLRNFIYKYAPPSENDTSNYLNWLVQSAGIGADQQGAELLNVGDSNAGNNGSSGSSYYNSLDFGTSYTPSNTLSVSSLGLSDSTIVMLGIGIMGLIVSLVSRR